MPLINFSEIRGFLQEKSTDRIDVSSDPDGLTQQVTSVASKAKEAAAQQVTTRAQAFVDNFQTGVRVLDGYRMRAPFGGTLNGDSRVGFVITSDIWRQENKAILLHAGPGQAQWTLPLRAQDEENKAGHARYAQARRVTPTKSALSVGGSNHTQTFYDFPRVDFEFQTGNILPIPLFLDEVEVPYGLDDFYLFLELLNQEPLIPFGTKEGKHNYVWIFYTSLQFPQIVLKGYFDPQGVSWADNAEAQTTFTWSSSFLVHEMSPNLWERDELRVAYTAFMKDNVKLF